MSGAQHRKKPHCSPARFVAYEVLRDVADRDAYANLALQARIREARLNDQDAAFATELTSGTLRFAGKYDAIIELATGRKISAIDPAVHTVLQLGVHQLVTLETPKHAAIHEQVELAKGVAGMRTSGFVNGVLRTVSRTSPEEWEARIVEGIGTDRDRLATLHSHPRWIVDALADALDAEGRGSELEATLIANNEPPRVQLAILEGEMTPELAGETLIATGVSPLAYELSSGNPAQVIAALIGAGVTAKVQDQGSQLAALTLTEAAPVRAGEAWLDLCAGPGGKTAVLAAAARQHGATVRANEVTPHRAELVRSSVKDFTDVVTIVSHDGRSEEAYDATEYDRILVDAPCSGLGALRRRPEARWRKKPSDVEPLHTLQRELLSAATAHLAPGGFLAYVTCSPHLHETRDVVEQHLREHEELELCESTVRVNGAGDHAATVQLWPHRDNADAMFIALMRKKDARGAETTEKP